MGKRFLKLLGLLILIVVIYLFTQKAPIDPAAYNPPPKPPMIGVLAPNDLLKKADLLALGQINVLLDKLFFANGVALSVAEDFVLHADRIGRYKLFD